MKNKEAKKPILQQDLVKYCEQIGITKIPTLVFSPQDFDKIEQGRRKTKRNRLLGCCSQRFDLILVNLEYINNPKKPISRWVYLRKGKYKRLIRPKWDLREARQTLVHELVHYRWSSMWHGYNFEKRIIEIVKGKRFEPRSEEKEKTPSPRLSPWIESYLSVYR